MALCAGKVDAYLALKFFIDHCQKPETSKRYPFAGSQHGARPYSQMKSSSSFGPERDAERSNGYDSDGLFNGAAANSAAHHSSHGLAGKRARPRACNMNINQVLSIRPRGLGVYC